MGFSIRWSDHLMTLTDRKAFGIFVIFFLVGVASLIGRYSVSWVLPGLVIGYSAVVFISQRRFFVSLTAETKNSPYFLGFLFTLCCLIRILGDLSPLGEGPAGWSTLLVPQIGAALSTTVLGLIGRYLIVSFDPAEEEQQALWRSATVELKENATAYQLSQRRLIDLVDAFTTAHRQILEQEETASQRHISELTETSAALSQLTESYTVRFQAIMTGFDGIRQQVDRFVDETLPAIHSRLAEGSSFHLQKLYNDFHKVASSAFTRMSNSLEGLQPKTERFESACQALFDQLPALQQQIFIESADRMREFQRVHGERMTVELGAWTDEVTIMTAKLQETGEQMASCSHLLDTVFAPGLKQAGEKLQGLAELATTSQQLNGEALAGLGDQIRDFDQVFKERLSCFQAEIHQIDQLIEAFIETTRRRIAI